MLLDSESKLVLEVLVTENCADSCSNNLRYFQKNLFSPKDSFPSKRCRKIAIFDILQSDMGLESQSNFNFEEK